MIEASPVGRCRDAGRGRDHCRTAADPDAAFITGSDFLMDGGVTASYFYGELGAITA